MFEKITISAYELLKRFPDANSARKYLESKRWPKGAVCPHCGCALRIQTRKLVGYYRCLSRLNNQPPKNLKQFTPRFERITSLRFFGVITHGAHG